MDIPTHSLVDLARSLEILIGQIQLLTWFVAFLGILVLAALLGAIYYFRKLVSLNYNRESVVFDAGKADHLYQSGALEELIDFSGAHTRTFPYSTEAYWYLALGHYAQGNFKEALTAFEQVLKINPNWSESAVPYIETIRGLEQEMYSRPPSCALN